MKSTLLAAATTLFLSALAANVGATVLFTDDFSSGTLDNWNYVVYGEVTASPTDSSNNVLTFSGTNSYGDSFSSLIDSTGAENYTLSFDYYTTDAELLRNGGGFVGIDADGVKGGEDGGPNGSHIWYLGTPTYSGVEFLPQAINEWRQVSYTFSLPDSWTQFSLMFEDFRKPAGDAFFDNIVLSDSNTAGASPVPEPATMLLFGVGLSVLASKGLRRRS